MLGSFAVFTENLQGLYSQLINTMEYHLNLSNYEDSTVKTRCYFFMVLFIYQIARISKIHDIHYWQGTNTFTFGKSSSIVSS